MKRCRDFYKDTPVASQKHLASFSVHRTGPSFCARLSTHYRLTPLSSSPGGSDDAAFLNCFSAVSRILGPSFDISIYFSVIAILSNHTVFRIYNESAFLKKAPFDAFLETVLNAETVTSSRNCQILYFVLVTALMEAL